METLVSLSIPLACTAGLVFYFVRGSRRSADDRFAARHRYAVSPRVWTGRGE